MPKSHVLKGRILIEEGKLEQARASFLEAEKLDEDCVEAQYYLGIVHERFNEPENAPSATRRPWPSTPPTPST